MIDKLSDVQRGFLEEAIRRGWVFKSWKVGRKAYWMYHSTPEYFGMTFLPVEYRKNPIVGRKPATAYGVDCKLISDLFGEWREMLSTLKLTMVVRGYKKPVMCIDIVDSNGDSVGVYFWIAPLDISEEAKHDK